MPPQDLTSFTRAAASTHVGGRSVNEDRVFVDETLGLFIVADGVGGQIAGEIASQIACDVVAEQVRAGGSLNSAIHAANAAVREGVPSGDAREGMASTIIVAREHPGALELAWVGDSRAYIWDGTSLSMLSRDQSLVESMVASGEIRWDQAANHPQRNVILQALGQPATRSLEVAFRRLTRLPRSTVILLCSDGLSDAVPAPELATHFQRAAVNDVRQTASTLIDAALAAKSDDNISVVVFRPELSNANPSPLSKQDFTWSYNIESKSYTHGALPASSA
ncbi:protein phosphatase [gamma proteobacterium NOR5-3]|nr:protein phosphatase [gamma proteobacterium NOR5-3]